MRKTIKVEELINEVNYLNSHSTCNSDIREGWNSILEHVLHNTETYDGFQYLTADRMRGEAAGQQPGIVYVDDKPVFPDETRRRYFVNKRLW